MYLFLPVAGVSVKLFLLVGLGASIGLLSGLFGVGGGFLLTPILMMVGVPATVAAASGSCEMVAASSSATAAHLRMGNVDAKIGCVMLAGGLAGGKFGVQVIRTLRVVGNAGLVITLSYVVLLSTLGAYMFFQSLSVLRRGAMAESPRKPAKAAGFFSRLPWQMDFPRSGVRHSVLIPLFLAAIVGFLASIMGVGGGFIMIPMMIYLLAMPAHIAVGTSLFEIMLLSAGITYMQATTNHIVDVVLVLPLAVGAAVGAQVGVRLTRLFRGEQLVILLATFVLVVAGKMTARLVVSPPSLLSPARVSRVRDSVAAGKMTSRLTLTAPNFLSSEAVPPRCQTTKCAAERVAVLLGDMSREGVPANAQDSSRGQFLFEEPCHHEVDAEACRHRDGD
jgi:uncharacterized protein